MKKLTLLFFSVLALSTVVVSCSKDDSPSGSDQIIAKTDGMIGRWVFDKYTSTSEGVTSAELPYNNPSCQDKQFVDLKSPGNLQYGNVDECVLTKYDGTWKVTNGVMHLYLTSDEGPFKVMDFSVISLSETKLILKYDNPFESNAYLTFTLNKQ